MLPPGFAGGLKRFDLSGSRLLPRRRQRMLTPIPGYTLFQNLTQQVAGDNRPNVWKPALVEIEETLVPAFIIEEFEDGRYTV